MTLAGQYLLLQVLIVLVVLLAVGAISVAQTARSFERSEVRPALSAAENLAATPIVRQRIAVARPGSRALASVGEASRTTSGSTSVFIAGSDGVVVSSSDPTQVGRQAPIGTSRVLSGASWTGSRDVGGHKTVVAQAPVYAETTGEVIGMVEIGRQVPSVWSRLGDVVPNLLVYLGVASVLGLGGSLLLSRRVKRQTLGMEPAEIAGLVEHREALVHGVKEGVIAIDEQQRVTVVNDSARQLLGLPLDGVGRRLDELELDRELVEALTNRQPEPDRLVLVGDRVLALNRRPMRSHGQVIGSVTTLRDRTELSALESELGTSRATSDTLRAQTHEFANQLHTISGLLQLEEYDEVMRFVDGVRLSRSSLYDEVTSRIDDATVAALLIAKASLATERGVELRLDPDSRVGKVYGALARDLTTVVGNLVDNALDAVSAAEQPRVDVRVVGGEGVLTVTVSDTGPGVPDTEAVFRQGWTTKAGDRLGRRGPRLRSRPDPAGLPAPRRRRAGPQRGGRGVHRDPAHRRRRGRGGRVIEVLVVDDDFMVARIHTGFVERTPGFRVTGVAHTGADALAEAERLQPDLVLLDVYLPDVSGLDLLGALREAAPEVDVLVISAAREADTVRRALRGGIVHYLMKPFTYDDLRVRLEHYEQAYIGLPGEETDQAAVDRVFGVRGSDKRLPKGFSPETLRLVEDVAAPGDRRPVRGGGGQPAGDLPGERPAVPRAPRGDRQGGGQPALRRGRPSRASLHLAVTGSRSGPPDRHTR